mmetsp:Transcript_36138/g.108521  ORF Transcript_36138/g.108521 Transcript_36138/m.108521 type:complete len:295 (-) Transcript_36138:229-1113(-)
MLIQAQTADELAAEVVPRIEAIGRITPMLDVWQATDYVSRLWCLFELHTAITNRETVSIDVISTGRERVAFACAIQHEGHGVIDAVMNTIQYKCRAAFQEGSRGAIYDWAQSLPGGWLALSSTIQKHLRAWYESTTSEYDLPAVSEKAVGSSFVVAASQGYEYVERMPRQLSSGPAAATISPRSHVSVAAFESALPVPCDEEYRDAALVREVDLNAFTSVAYATNAEVSHSRAPHSLTEISVETSSSRKIPNPVLDCGSATYMNDPMSDVNLSSESACNSSVGHSPRQSSTSYV